MKKLVILLVVIVASHFDLSAQAIYDRSSIKCIGVELDGSQTLRVLGYGRNRADAKEQAMKNAVWAVIFDGIRDGVKGCNTRPLVTEVNAKERYEDYFNIFFVFWQKTNGVFKKINYCYLIAFCQITNNIAKNIDSIIIVIIT